MRILASSAIAALAMATPAMSQERDPFTGARVEGIAGWDRLQSGGRKDDAVYGVGVGYDKEIGQFLLGVEGEAAGSKNEACNGGTTVPDPRLCSEAERDLYIGGRVGGVIAKGVLLYAKAGYANARVRFNSDDGTAISNFGKRDLNGWRVGGGAEFALGPNMFAKAEYRYSKFEGDLQRHQVVGGFGIRF